MGDKVFKKLYIFSAILIANFAIANEVVPNEELPPKSLFGNGKDWKKGFYGAPVIKISRLGSGVGVAVGGRVAFIVNRTMTFGAGGYGLITHSDLVLSGNSSGLYMGYG